MSYYIERHATPLTIPFTLLAKTDTSESLLFGQIAGSTVTIFEIITDDFNPSLLSEYYDELTLNIPDYVNHLYNALFYFDQKSYRLELKDGLWQGVSRYDKYAFMSPEGYGALQPLSISKSATIRNLQKLEESGKLIMSDGRALADIKEPSSIQTLLLLDKILKIKPYYLD